MPAAGRPPPPLETKQDEDGYFWLLGRIDDVMNVSGHRLSTIEIESALVAHEAVAEAAAAAAPDGLTGQTPLCFVVLRKESSWAGPGRGSGARAVFRAQVRLGLRLRRFLGVLMRVGVLTGGGDCPGLNAVIRAVVRRGEVEHGDTFVGFRDGWKGLTENLTRPLDVEHCRGILPRGGTILGTSRTNPYKVEGGVEAVRETLKTARHRRSRRHRRRRHPRRRAQALAGGRAGRRSSEDDRQRLVGH